MISRYAELRVPDTARTFVSPSPLSVKSQSGFVSKLWFYTPPLDDMAVDHLAAVQLLTTSNDQGWATSSQGDSWTWFEVGVFKSPEELAQCEKVGQGEQGWRWSHGNKGATSMTQDRKGRLVTAGEDILKRLGGGSVLAVRICAKYPMWANNAHRGELKFWKWFEPVVSVE